VLPDYLWGIETSFHTRSCRALARASRLPMRNWNLTYLLSDRLSSSFQTTYEELKLLLSMPAMPKAMLPDYLWGIETPATEPSSLSLRSGFQTTYEELKRPSKAIVINSKRKLPDYLWGIETYYKRDICYRPEALPDYLWGIETPVWCLAALQSTSCFQTTYEELKLKKIFRRSL